ncbi:MAG: rhodanese-like domain-containing protein [Bacteroidetes bacterium]|nr:rhodanese-like domain-containing protein [Bacteroidota bacterium]
MNTLKEIVKQAGTTIVDVRSTWEVEMGQYPGAINIPIEELSQRVSEFKAFEGPIVLYCRSGQRSGMALQFLKQQGFENLYNGGGLEEMLKLA